MDEQGDLFEILIVEDDEDDIFLLTHALGEVGLINSSHFFPNVKDLVDYCEDHCCPSLILLNAFSPGKNIREAIAALKGNQNLVSVPIVLMLGANSEKEYLRSFHLEVYGYIVKPLDAKVLKRVIKKRQ
jgi:CheY-like chemotaxis protein